MSAPEAARMVLVKLGHREYALPEARAVDALKLLAEAREVTRPRYDGPRYLTCNGAALESVTFADVLVGPPPVEPVARKAVPQERPTSVGWMEKPRIGGAV